MGRRRDLGLRNESWKDQKFGWKKKKWMIRLRNKLSDLSKKAVSYYK